jgi:predicted RNA methylase
MNAVDHCPDKLISAEKFLSAASQRVSNPPFGWQARRILRPAFRRVMAKAFRVIEVLVSGASPDTTRLSITTLHSVAIAFNVLDACFWVPGRLGSR